MVQRQINILLLGETGVGKTTFINMLPNYLENEPLSTIASRNLHILAPINFTLINNNFEEKLIHLGDDQNEVSTTGASSTQRPRMYVYNLPTKNATLQVIDTPGIGDTRGIEWDKRNTEVLLRYISEVKFIDAVFILLKPDSSRFSVLFEHCLRIILKELVVNIRNNLVFVFTKSRGTFYTPGETYGPLKKTIQNLQNETNSIVPFGKNNTFCIDNEAFRYLAATKQGVTFRDDEIAKFTESYDHSSNIVKRMIDYVTTLTPVPMQNVATPNESKRVILRLSKPLLSLLTNYEKAVDGIQQYEAMLQANESNVDTLKQNLFKIEHKRIVKEHNTYDHHQSHSVGVNIGASFPPFMINGTVGYNFSDDTRTHKTEDVDFVENRVLDEKVYSMITDQNSARAAVQTKIIEMNNLRDEYKKEMVTVLSTIATFYVYSKENNMSPSDDPFIKALESAKDEAVLDNKQMLAEEFSKIIKRYEIKKNAISDVQPEDIQEVIKELFALPHSGETFKQLMDIKFSFHSIRLTR